MSAPLRPQMAGSWPACPRRGETRGPSWAGTIKAVASLTQGAGIHPDLPETLVHFTGRPRVRADDLPPHFGQGPPDDRLARIAHAGAIYAARVWGTRGPVVCMSEASPAALVTLFSTGVTYRGPYAPWAVILNRATAVTSGIGPVWYMGDDAMAATETLPAHLADRRVRYVPGRADWLAEREWRLCWGDTPIAPGSIAALGLPGLATGVIVGSSGWLPPPRPFIDGPQAGQLAYAWPVHGLARWWWNGQALAFDGTIDIQAQASSYGTPSPSGWSALK